MTQEEWSKLTEEEYLALPYEVILKHFIRFTEERYISYKKLIEEEYKDKTVYEPGDWRIEFNTWFKEHLREMKNYEEGNLKRLQLELKYGGDIPFWLKLKKKVKVECPTCEGKGVISE